MANDEQQYVFWGIPSGFIREAHHADRGTPVRTFHSWRTIAAPTVGVDAANHDQYVFWQNVDRDIVESWYPTRHQRWWAHHAMKSWPRTIGSPSVAVADDNQQYLFWQDLSGAVGEAHHTTSWRLYGFSHWRPALPGSAVSVTTNCTAKDLGIRFEKQSGAAGSVYLDFGFVSVSSHTCRLHGYPGVSAVTAGGAAVDFQVAHRTSQPERTVMVAPGAKASFSLATGQVTTPCRTVTAWRFIPPNDRRDEQIARRTRVCGDRLTESPVVPAAADLSASAGGRPAHIEAAAPAVPSRHGRARRPLSSPRGALGWYRHGEAVARGLQPVCHPLKRLPMTALRSSTRRRSSRTQAASGEPDQELTSDAARAPPPRSACVLAEEIDSVEPRPSYDPATSDRHQSGGRSGSVPQTAA